MDRLSGLPEDLLLHILSFLPTKFAARTSLISRRFLRLWESSPAINLDTYAYSSERVTPSQFVHVTDRIVLNRHPPSGLLCLNLYLLFRSNEIPLQASYIASLIEKAGALGLRHLTLIILSIEMWESILPRILALRSLESLKLQYLYFHELITPSTPINWKHLRNLSIDIHGASHVGADCVNRLVPQLSALEDLYIRSWRYEDSFNLKSMTIRKVKLDLVTPNLRISAPFVEHFELKSDFHFPLSQGVWEMPMLRKAVIQLNFIYVENAELVTKMLNTIAHVEELHLNITEELFQKDTFRTLLVPSVDPPTFIKMKYFHLEICFHEFNIEDLVTIIQHSDALESLELVHKPPNCAGKDKKRNLWRSMLPRNVEGNYRHAYFRDLNIAEKKDELLRKLIRKQSSKRRKK